VASSAVPVASSAVPVASSAVPVASSAVPVASSAVQVASSAVPVASSLKSQSSKQDLYKLLDTTFYTYSTEYTPWCLDIVLISFIVQKQKPKDLITSSQIMNIFDEVMQKNKFSSKPYLKDALQAHREKFQETIADKYNDTENVLLLHHLLGNYGKWDLYSATVLFMDMLEKIHQAPSVVHVEEIKRGLGFIE
jgi:hypothetical protein